MAAFPATRIEGGLFGPDILDQLLAAELAGQKAADFGLDARRNLTDEIAAAFADARALWGVFQHRLQRLPEDDLATTVTRDAWMIPFLGLLGYEARFNARAREVDGLSFAISHRTGEAEESSPVHIVGARQELGRVPASGRPRLAPHSLVQEYLNRTEYLWGVVANGLTLRLLRNSTFVRRQAYVEFDLAAIFDEQRFQDFAVLYRLLHRTRLPRGPGDANQCLLEQYYLRSIDQGGRVREHLREGVEECIKQLGNGFLKLLANEDLRLRAAPDSTAANRISPGDLYRQLLRLVYRFLFLLVSEERRLVSTDPVYHEHYSIARLRRILDSRAAYTEDDDLWQGLRVLWKVLCDERLATFLRVAPLNGELFSALDIDACTISNRDLLEAFSRLAWYQESPSSPRRRVNYAALDVEELGSVYESLLEFHPAVDADGAGRLEFRLIFGSERKTTGSYYTPPQLVNELVQSALEPVICEKLAANPNAREKALLSIRVCDPACGSGHFLLAAARRLGKELARIRSGEDEPAPERVREATRDVISHCIYGVDRNPLAVDLCRVALWLESHTGAKPLTFLDHRIRGGDSLVGVFDLAVLARGIPDKAFEPLEGDDKAVARDTMRRNREEVRGQQGLFTWDSREALERLGSGAHGLDSIGDDTPDDVREKKRRFEAAHRDATWLRQREACDLWTAAFFQPLNPGIPVITSGAVIDRLSERASDPRLSALAWAIAERERFFHWPVEFPDVFQGGGFDVILSNPPWEHVELKEQEYFAARDARIATAPTKAARTRLITELKEQRPALFQEYIEHLRSFDGARLFMAQSGRYPLSGRGRINTYAVFSEFASLATNQHGRSGLVVPTGIATDDTTKLFFSALVRAGRLVDLVGFENEEFIFPAVHHAFKFCKITIGAMAKPVERSRIAFYLRKFADLTDKGRFFELEKSDFILLNPNTGNCPIFRAEADAELTKAIYRRIPVLWRDGQDGQPEKNPWRIKFSQGLFNMSSDSHHFRNEAELLADGYRQEGNVFVSSYDRYLPLFEAKMLHQFDHRFSTYEDATEQQISVGILPQVPLGRKRDSSFVVQPRYWVREEVLESAIPKYPEPLAVALRLQHKPSIQRVLAMWAASVLTMQGTKKEAKRLLDSVLPLPIEREVAKAFGEGSEADHMLALGSDFPLSDIDVRRIEAEIETPEPLARELVERFSPKWFLGWRDITNSTNERTTIASVTPRVAIGHTFSLAFSRGVPASRRICLLANLNSFVADYVARQKVGGMHITYNLLKQFPMFPQDVWCDQTIRRTSLAQGWFIDRLAELL